MKVGIVELGDGLGLRAVNTITGPHCSDIYRQLKATVRRLYEEIRAQLRDEGARNRAMVVLFGVGCGLAGGCVLGMWIARPYAPAPCMKAIVCNSFRDPDNLAICPTGPPSYRSPADVLVRVRAASLQRIDRRLSFGYGRTIRRLLASGGSHEPELPLVLGRSCAGTVEAIGSRYKGSFEVGDAVWLASAWYEPGLAAEFVVVPEARLSSMPAGLEFAHAASLPYSGSVALQLMQAQRLTGSSCADKEILVHGANTPVGCIVTQLAVKWGARVVATCPSQFVALVNQLGAKVIAFDSCGNIEKSNGLGKFNYIFLATHLRDTNAKFFEKLLTKGGVLVDAVEPDLASDEYGIVRRLVLAGYAGVRKAVAWVCGRQVRWDGLDLGQRTLATLATYVEDKAIHTLGPVQIFSPSDAGAALELVASGKPIGNTVITFAN
ncbi:reticulon-4-interacting protein 1 homolog, mitochondrial-like [Anopheles ziemanni]|uniref:reticulon-4-interacting protein 1 homolog, mitochondrial-like n=1 Tax=Anopheles coustani TaxID=139045 RepID=UPI00265AF6F2|nr:reticulon-4-interacting protein 1 homolog, mitochondrial-like [Anopheles coustani]XP_058175652.1 reticulon-4-interacting protein 1 homolog, mitochondrial-like [Anopheles ziemanni]